LFNYYVRDGIPENATLALPGPAGIENRDFDAPDTFQFDSVTNYLLNTTDKGDLQRINRVGIDPGRAFTDHAFIYNFPVSKPEISGENSFFKTLHASINLEYSYYMQNYETALASTNANFEQYLPNIYMLDDLSGRENIKWGENTNSDYKHIMHLEGFGDSAYWYGQGSVSDGSNPVNTMGQAAAWDQATGKTSSEATGLDIGKAADQSFSNYLRKWSSFFNKHANQFAANIASAPDAAPEIFSRSRNIIIPPQRVKDLAAVQTKKMLLPMSTEIEFTTDSNSEFGDFLVKTNIWDNLLSEVISSVDGQGGEYDAVVPMKGYAEQETISNQSIDSSAPQIQNITTSAFNQTNAKIFNLDKWLRDTTKEKFKTASQSAVVLDPDYKFNSLKNKNRRTYQDILEGKTCYNETVFYRVAKIDPETSDVIQSFYFVNSSDADVIKYVDTQIAYGKNYQYRIYAWQLVFGSEYEYKDVFFKDLEVNNTTNVNTPRIDASGFNDLFSHPKDRPALIDLRVRDSAVLMELPYYDPSPIRVLDDPPVPPDVQMIPYKNVGDKILMFLSSNTGEYELKPEVIEESDKLALTLLREAKGYGPEDKIRYTTDDHISTYEVFRITEKPTSYLDFAKQKLTTVGGHGSFVDDTISPNRKYYYTFRSIDNHGFASNPTVVYELEMVQDLDSVYANVKTHSMEDLAMQEVDRGKTSSKTVKKYIHIKPSLTQTEINYDVSEDLDDFNSAKDIIPTIGLEDHSLMGKKFKIRLTSKKTGKRIDFNLDFRTSYDMTNVVIK
jgi:hypothetical protein